MHRVFAWNYDWRDNEPPPTASEIRGAAFGIQAMFERRGRTVNRWLLSPAVWAIFDEPDVLAGVPCDVELRDVRWSIVGVQEGE